MPVPRRYHHLFHNAERTSSLLSLLTSGKYDGVVSRLSREKRGRNLCCAQLALNTCTQGISLLSLFVFFLLGHCSLSSVHRFSDVYSSLQCCCCQTFLLNAIHLPRDSCSICLTPRTYFEII